MTLVKVHNPLAKNLDGFVKEFFNEFPTSVAKSLREDVLHYPPVNIIDQANSYVLEISAPGFDKTDFAVKLENNLLSISAAKKEKAEETTEKMIRREFSSKAFSRTFTVDDKIDGENISAKYENGILKLELAKKEIVKPEAKQIVIS